MVFDWFRRQYSQAQGKPQPEPEAAQPTPAEPAEPKAGTPSSEPVEARSADSKTDSETTAEPGPAVEEDYLAWAKAAYKNLKQQEAETQDGAGAAEATPSEVAPSEVTAEAAASEVTAALPAATPPEAESVGADHQPESPDASLEESAEAEAIAAPDSAPEPEAAEPEPEAAAPETAEPAPVSFLQRAEADRQARLDRLKAEAPDEPETLSAKSPAQNLEDPPLDEDFIWSAEVLAAQGRRPDEVAAEEIDWLTQLRQGLGKTRQNLLNQLKSIVGQGPLGASAIEDIEAILLQADVGVEATDSIVELLQEKLRQEALPPEQAIAYLKGILRDILDRPLKAQGNPILAPTHGQLNVWLLVGVNGAGKTTTIGKLGHMGKKSGYECLIAAADTFRAAAVQQVQTWGDRTGIEVIANPGKNTDPAAVVFDALTAAKSRKTELLLVDTAGRLQNKKNLMAELSKIRRIIDKNAENAVVESLLVLDASLGQNGVRQAEVFAEAANLSGVVLTKLDGSAKGGVALAVTQKLGLPIRFVGAGEGIEDLRPFSSYEFVEALLGG